MPTWSVRQWVRSRPEHLDHCLVDLYQYEHIMPKEFRDYQVIADRHVGEGSTFAGTLRLWGRELAVTGHVVRANRLSEVVMEWDYSGGVLITRYELTPQEGGTEVRLSIGYEVPPLGSNAWMSRLVYQSALRQFFGEQLLRLAREAEALEDLNIAIGG